MGLLDRRRRALRPYWHLTLPYIIAAVTWLALALLSFAQAAPVERLPDLSRAPVVIALPRLPAAATTPSLPAPVMAGLSVPSADAAVPSAAAPVAQLESLGGAIAPLRPGDAAPARASAALSSSYDNGRAPRAGDDDAAPVPSSAEGPALPPSASPRRQAEEPPKPPSPPRPAGVKRYLGFLPNLLTGLNMTSGVAAIMLLMHGGALPLAGGLIVLANVFDAFDGRAARWLGNHDPTGIDADSLADIVSFGVAPALLAYKAALSGLGPAALVPAALFVAGGWWRLKRFNVGARVEAEGAKPKTGYFTGLPIPGGAGVIVAFVLALPLLAHALAPTIVTAVAAVVTMATAGAMVSTLPYPNFKLGGPKALVPPVVIGAAIAGALALAGHPLLIPAGLFGAYLTTGPAIGLWRGASPAFKKEFKRKLFHVLGLAYIPALRAFGVHALPALAAFVALSALSEFARLKVPALKPLFAPFGGIIREKEAHRPSGFFYAALGILTAGTLFGIHSVYLAGGIAALFLGDPVSPLVGLRFPVGLYKAMGTTRSWPGSLAGALTALGVALVLGFSPLVALGAAVAFSLVDIFPVKPDDNFWIPVVYSAALFLLTRFL